MHSHNSDSNSIPFNEWDILLEINKLKKKIEAKAQKYESNKLDRSDKLDKFSGKIKILKENIKYKEQIVASNSHSISFHLEKLAGLKQETNALRSKYVDLCTSFSLIDADIRFQQDSAEQDELLQRNEINKKNKDVIFARNVLKESITESYEIPSDSKSADKLQTTSMVRILDTISENIEKIKEIEKSVNENTDKLIMNCNKNSTELLKNKIDLMDDKIVRAKEDLGLLLNLKFLELVKIKNIQAELFRKINSTEFPSDHISTKDIKDLDKIISRCLTIDDNDSSSLNNSFSKIIHEEDEASSSSSDESSRSNQLSSVTLKNDKTKKSSIKSIHLLSRESLLEKIKEMYQLQGRYNKLYSLKQGLELHINQQILLLLVCVSELNNNLPEEDRISILKSQYIDDKHTKLNQEFQLYKFQSIPSEDILRKQIEYPKKLLSEISSLEEMASKFSELEDASLYLNKEQSFEFNLTEKNNNLMVDVNESLTKESHKIHLHEIHLDEIYRNFSDKAVKEANNVASSLAGNSFETILTKLSSVMLTVASNTSEKNSIEGSNYANKVTNHFPSTLLI